MDKKEFTLKINNNKHFLIFHMCFTEEEAKNTTITVGFMKPTETTDKQQFYHVESRSISLLGLIEKEFCK